MAEEKTEIDIELKQETDGAWLVVSVDTGEEAWIPKRCSSLELGRDKVSGKLTLPEKMAVEKGLV